MDTLRGIFPEPKVPPKRNFIKENVKKLQDIQKLNNMQKNNAMAGTKKRSKSRCSSSTTTSTTTALSNNNKPLNEQNPFDDKQQQQQQKFKINCNTNKVEKLSINNNNNNIKSKNTLEKTPIITQNNEEETDNVIINVENSVDPEIATTIATTIKQLKNASSQTGDINDEEFLKDTIIIYPSASVLEKLKSSDKESLGNIGGDGDGNFLSPDSQLNINMPVSATTTTSSSSNAFVSTIVGGQKKSDIDRIKIGVKRIKRHSSYVRDEYQIKRDEHTDNLREFLETGAIKSKRKPVVPVDEQFLREQEIREKRIRKNFFGRDF